MAGLQRSMSTETSFGGPLVMGHAKGKAHRRRPVGCGTLRARTGSTEVDVFRAQPDRVSTLPEIFGSVATRVSSPRPVLPASRNLRRP